MQNLKLLLYALLVLSIELSDVVKNETVKFLVFKQNSSIYCSNIFKIINKKIITLISLTVNSS
jgi:uncharacterized protein YhbP (UPF0306 family)